MELVTKKRLQLFSGRSHTPLAEEIADHLDVQLGEANLSQFANGELHCRFGESIRGSDVFIVQTHSLPVNEAIMEQLIMIDAAKRASAKRITAVCPFYGYARQDRKASGREPITAKLVADMLAHRGRQPHRQRRPPLRPDPGLLRRAGRPPHRDAGARRLPARARSTAISRSSRPTRAGSTWPSASASTSTPTSRSSTSAAARTWPTSSRRAR